MNSIEKIILIVFICFFYLMSFYYLPIIIDMCMRKYKSKNETQKLLEKKQPNYVLNEIIIGEDIYEL